MSTVAHAARIYFRPISKSIALQGTLLNILGGAEMPRNNVRRKLRFLLCRFIFGKNEKLIPRKQGVIFINALRERCKIVMKTVCALFVKRPEGVEVICFRETGKVITQGQCKQKMRTLSRRNQITHQIGFAHKPSALFEKTFDVFVKRIERSAKSGARFHLGKRRLFNLAYAFARNAVSPSDCFERLALFPSNAKTRRHNVPVSIRY